VCVSLSVCALVGVGTNERAHDHISQQHFTVFESLQINLV